MIFPYNKKTPVITEGVFVAPDAVIVGDVQIDEDSSVWFGTVLRGDINMIRVGKQTNIQDRAVLHVDHDAPCIIGNFVSIGHGAIVHGAEIGDECLIGMGAVVLSHCRVGPGSVIGAGAVVREGTEIPPRSLVVGVPGRIVRTLELEENPGRRIAESYRELAAEYCSQQQERR
ncbi:MAG TPA: gamma carbonic anhydrase family protein [bacterium]|nr:gamma carbonic anhydrase family protein [bacterium]HPO07357.1 gamma carbonic anhydrase family protein [bacterium]HQO33681.1 gamma carbonic anhydrase family protein [bacterium]HQQ00065.1 gamma carbonic anhydrase family protein [bacterium]